MAQPIIHLATGELAADELIPLIVRSPRAGSSVAQDFVRDVGVVDIDAWVVQRAAYLAARGRRVHVGVSATSATTATFMPRVERAIDRAAVDPRLLTFGFSESFAVGDTAAAASVAATLAGFGCRIAIDDCAPRGATHDYLTRIPADFLRIDPWLVGGALDERSSVRAISAIVEAARSRGLATIANGVHEEELRILLLALEVDYAQGFHSQRDLRC